MKWLLSLLLACAPAWAYPPGFQGDVPDSEAVTCLYENLTAGHAEQFPVIVHLERGKPEHGYRICLRDAQDWPPGPNSVRLATRRADGSMSPYAEKVIPRPAGSVSGARLVGGQIATPPPESAMAAEITGTIQWVDASGSDVTVPSDAQVALIFGGAYIGTTSSFASASLAGSGAATVLASTTGDSNYRPTVGLAAVAVSATGTRALSYAFSHAAEDGGAAGILFLKGVTLGDVVRDIAAASRAFAGSATVTVDSEATDLVLAFGVGQPPPLGSGYTSLSTHSYALMDYQVAAENAVTSPDSSYGDNLTDYTGYVLVSIKAGGGGAASSAPPRRTFPMALLNF